MKKFTPEQKSDMLKQYQDNVPIKNIATQYSVSEAYVCRLAQLSDMKMRRANRKSPQQRIDKIIGRCLTLPDLRKIAKPFYRQLSSIAVDSSEHQEAVRLERKLDHLWQMMEGR